MGPGVCVGGKATLLKESTVFETADSEVNAGHWRPRNSKRIRAAKGISGCCNGCSANYGVSNAESPSPRLGGDDTATPIRERRKEFSISLSRQEIEEDLKAGRRPPRRPELFRERLVVGELHIVLFCQFICFIFLSKHDY